MSSSPAVPAPRNPTPLSATQEAGVQETYHRRVRGHCAQEIKAFAECATGRTLTATWKCRDQRLAMNGCMIAHATREEQDAARAEWFASRDARRAAREEELRKEDELKRRQGDWWAEYHEQKRKEKEKGR